MPDRRWRRSFSWVLALSLGLVGFTVMDLITDGGAFIPRAPIYIDGNGDFTPANGVTGGSGTPLDPYIIDGWEIGPGVGNLVQIVQTDAHFIIRTLFVHSAGGFGNALRLQNVSNGVIENSNFSDCFGGIIMNSTSNMVLSNNNVSLNQVAIDSGESRNLTLAGNRILANSNGVNIWNSDGVTIAANEVESSRFGISITDSFNITLDGNNFTHDGVLLHGESIPHFTSHNISQSNLVNNLPLRYLKDCSGIVLDGVLLGQLILANCTNVTVANLSVSDTDAGIQAAFLDSVVIENVTVSRTYAEGIIISLSAGVRVVRCNVTESSGLLLSDTTDSEVIGNSIMANDPAVAIRLRDSARVLVQRNELFWNSGGIGVAYSENITIMGNDIFANNGTGVDLGSSANATIRNNTISASTSFGIRVVSSNGSSIFHNNILGNSIQAWDSEANENSWDDGYPSGGNFWSDYPGVDQFNGPNQNIPGPDGIGDSSYDVDSNTTDSYPLTTQWPIPPAPPSQFWVELYNSSSKDLQFTWNLSLDDGGGRSNVIGYELRCAPNFDPTASTYSIRASVSNGTTQLVLIGAGHGNASHLFCSLAAVDGDGGMGLARHQVGKFVRQLDSSPQLISLPLQPKDIAIGSILRTVNLSWAVAYDPSDLSDSWKRYDPARTWSDLAQGTPNVGLWVKLLRPGNWTIAGRVLMNYTVTLAKGWNLVGYPSLLNRTVSEAFAGLPVQSVEGYDPATPYHLRALSSADEMTSGDAYWVDAASSFEWTLVDA